MVEAQKKKEFEEAEKKRIANEKKKIEEQLADIELVEEKEKLD